MYANNTDIPAAYFRAYYDNDLGRTYIREYQFLFDTKKLSADAAKVLFKDDVRGHIINPDALFDRDYVFKQFHEEKQDFGDYCDVALEKSSAIMIALTIISQAVSSTKSNRRIERPLRMS